MAGRPMKWIRESTPEEIAEAIIAVDLEKAAMVAGVLMSQCGARMGERLDHILDSYKGRTEDAIGQFLKGGISRLFG